MRRKVFFVDNCVTKEEVGLGPRLEGALPIRGYFLAQINGLMTGDVWVEKVGAERYISC